MTGRRRATETAQPATWADLGTDMVGRTVRWSWPWAPDDPVTAELTDPGYLSGWLEPPEVIDGEGPDPDAPTEAVGVWARYFTGEDGEQLLASRPVTWPVELL